MTGAEVAVCGALAEASATTPAGAGRSSRMINAAVRNRNGVVKNDLNCLFIILLLRDTFHNKLHRLFQHGGLTGYVTLTYCPGQAMLAEAPG